MAEKVLWKQWISLREKEHLQRPASQGRPTSYVGQQAAGLQRRVQKADHRSDLLAKTEAIATGGGVIIAQQKTDFKKGTSEGEVRFHKV